MPLTPPPPTLKAVLDFETRVIAPPEPVPIAFALKAPVIAKLPEVAVPPEVRLIDAPVPFSHIGPTDIVLVVNVSPRPAETVTDPPSPALD